MKFMEKLKKAKKDNKGFSLVELIIVIAIMAILVGIVGTQVIPYINRSKEAKDFQIVNSFSTAAMTAYGSNAEAVEEEAAGGTVTVYVYGTTTNTTDVQKKLAKEIQELTYDGSASGFFLGSVFSSTEGQKITDVVITYDFNKRVIKTQAIKAVTESEDPNVFDAIESKM